MTETKKRLHYVDMLTGTATIFVVLYHLIAPSAVKTVLNHLVNGFLPVFFLLSGFLYTPGKRKLKETLKKRTGALLRPFVQYSLLFWLIGSVYLIATQSETVFEALCCLRNFYGGCIWNRVLQDLFHWEYYRLGSRYLFLADFWFLPAMILAGLLFYPLAEKVLDSGKKTAAVIICLFLVSGILRHYSISLVYNLQLVPFWSGLMLTGALAASAHVVDLNGMGNGKKAAVSLVLSVLGIVLCMVSEPALNLYRGTFAEGREFLSMIEIIVSSLLLGFGLLELLKLAEEKGFQGKVLTWFGVNSMDIYLFHMFFAWIISIITGFSLKYDAVYDASVFAGSLLLAVGSIVLSVLAHLLKEKLTATGASK